MWKTIIIALAACCLLAGCVETRFEAPPGDNIETCDTAWKGLWFTQDDDGQRIDGKHELTGFNVDDACVFNLFEQPEAGGPLKFTRIPINFVHARGGDYVVVADSALRALGDIPPPYDIDPAPAKSYFFVKYRVRGDRLELYNVDSSKAARLVIDGKLDGTVQKGRNSLHVYVRGGRAQMLEALRRLDLFESKSMNQFRRSKQSLQDFERSLQHATGTAPRQ